MSFLFFRNIILRLLESYWIVVMLALVCALVFPKYSLILTPYSTFFLQIIFFLTSLKLNTAALLFEFKDVWSLGRFCLVKLCILPAVLFLIAQWFVPDLALAFLVLGIVPAGMTSPLLVEITGGKPGKALALTIICSLLAPFTIPLMTMLFASTSVSVSAFTMFTTLLQVIVFPFFLAQGIRWLFLKKITSFFPSFKPVSILFLGLLIMGAVAKQTTVIFAHFDLGILYKIFLLSILIVISFVFGYVGDTRRTSKDTTEAICMSFMNFTLAIYLADAFFIDPNVLLMSVLVIFPWTLLLLPLKRLSGIMTR